MIINDIRPVMKAALPGVTDTWDNLYSFFLNRVRDNLHVMLCFSPVGNKFSTRAQQFPGLINGCTIDWFLPWPEEALTSGTVSRVLPHQQMMATGNGSFLSLQCQDAALRATMLRRICLSRCQVVCVAISCNQLFSR